eukprot:CAMPEP_0116936468 /NCGR_PEP_ID=MMETSP0467-20121206/30908_1 /TAXON_ID=283647 /ORGANISM="Mesodinium pulex, Strain SPMC105" /LENGTH=301 /DNA_ID=CAMNT_0004618061 /DNA_START=292 /DNA_END=1200 /DNA_ORIENTATION=-
MKKYDNINDQINGFLQKLESKETKLAKADTNQLLIEIQKNHDKIYNKIKTIGSELKQELNWRSKEKEKERDGSEVNATAHSNIIKEKDLDPINKKCCNSEMLTSKLKNIENLLESNFARTTSPKLAERKCGQNRQFSAVLERTLDGECKQARKVGGQSDLDRERDIQVDPDHKQEFDGVKSIIRDNQEKFNFNILNILDDTTRRIEHNLGGHLDQFNRISEEISTITFEVGQLFEKVRFDYDIVNSNTNEKFADILAVSNEHKSLLSEDLKTLLKSQFQLGMKITASFTKVETQLNADKNE